MDSLSLPSYAKINVGLLIRDKREDGYHDIATIFQQIDLCDELRFQRTDGVVRVSSTDSSLPLGEENLAFKAFQVFRERLSCREGLAIHITKRIPVGSGLGGGSSNAAATLLAANLLWGNLFSRTQLAEMAIAIGSDVPFFLYGGTALGQGRGEVLTPLHWPLDWWIVLVCPGFRISTSWAYNKAKIALTKEEKFTKFKSIFNKHIQHAPREVLINDLEGVVFRRHPILRELKDHMYRWDAFYASMSGSGSSVFGLFKNHERAEELRTSLITRKDVTVFLCRPINCHPLQGIQ